MLADGIFRREHLVVGGIHKIIPQRSGTRRDVLWRAHGARFNQLGPREGGRLEQPWQDGFLRIAIAFRHLTPPTSGVHTFAPALTPPATIPTRWRRVKINKSIEVIGISRNAGLAESPCRGYALCNPARVRRDNPTPKDYQRLGVPLQRAAPPRSAPMGGN